MAEGLRDLVYATLCASPALIAAGLGVNDWYPNTAPDSPSQRRFAVLRWGAAEPRAGRDTTARGIELQIWVYDRETDFSVISEVLRAAPAVLRALEGKPTGRGWVLSAEDQGQGPDLWDQVYAAAVRSSSFRIVASGE